VDPDAWPKTQQAAMALVALVLAEIMERDSTARDELLDDFMKAAWPSARASRQ
jgi:hypothetical protein